MYQLPFDYLKIDQSFIRDQNNIPIVLAIIEMANKLDIMTVAEGVETLEQMAFLEANGWMSSRATISRVRYRWRP